MRSCLRRSRCALTAPFHPYLLSLARQSRRSIFCCTGRPDALKHPSRTLSGTLPCGVRTFLSPQTPLRVRRAAIARPPARSSLTGCLGTPPTLVPAEYRGGCPPPVSWLEVESFVQLTSHYRLQNIVNKRLMPKILSIKDLEAAKRVKGQISCAPHPTHNLYFRVYACKGISYAKLNRSF